MVIDNMGSALTTKEEIKGEAVRFFSDLLTKEPANFIGVSVERLRELLPFRCSFLQQENLITEVTETEVQNIIFTMPMKKSSGPDGYSVKFFKGAWSVVVQDLTKAIQSFFYLWVPTEGAKS